MSDVMHVCSWMCPYPPSLLPSLSPSIVPSLTASVTSVNSVLTRRLTCEQQRRQWRWGQDSRREENRGERRRVEGWEGTLLCGTRTKIRNTTYHHHSQSASSMSFSQYLSLTLYFLISFFLSWNTPKILQFSRAFLSFKISFISLLQYPFLMTTFLADLCGRANERKWIR